MAEANPAEPPNCVRRSKRLNPNPEANPAESPNFVRGSKRSKPNPEANPAESPNSVRGSKSLTPNPDPNLTQITGANNLVVHQAAGSKLVINQNDGQYLNASDKEIRLVAIGRTGEGKSSTCNSILGEKRFKTRPGFRSISKEAEYMKKEIDGHELAIVDTPGIFDTDDEQWETLLEIMKCLVLSSPGPHAFLLVISLLRYTNEAREAVAILRKHFGPDALSNTIIVFTRKDELGDSMTEDEALDEATEDLRYLIKECGGRYVWFNNKAEGEERKRQVSCLLQKVKENQSFFSSEAYAKVEASLKKEIHKKASKVRKAYEEELQNLRKIIENQTQQLEVLQSNPRLTSKNKVEMKQLKKKLEANKRLFEEKETAMKNTIIGLREKIRESIADFRKNVLASGAVSGAMVGAPLGLIGAPLGFIGAPLGLIGAVYGGFVGAVIGGVANGLVRYYQKRREDDRSNELIEKMNKDVFEVLLEADRKLHESDMETQEN